MWAVSSHLEFLERKIELNIEISLVAKAATLSQNIEGFTNTKT